MFKRDSYLFHPFPTHHFGAQNRRLVFHRGSMKSPWRYLGWAMQKRCGPVHSRSTPSFRKVSCFFLCVFFMGIFLGSWTGKCLLQKWLTMYICVLQIWSNWRAATSLHKKIKKHGRLCAISMAVVKWLSVCRGSTTVWGNRCSCFLMIFHHSPNAWLAGCFSSVIDWKTINHMKGIARRTINHQPEPPTKQCWNYISAI